MSEPGTKKKKPAGPMQLTPFRKWSLWIVGTAVWATGALWVIFHYFMKTEGEFGFQNHPLESVWLMLHGLTAAASLWLFGLLWGVHVETGWAVRWRRRSGGTLTGTLIFLAVSGYALYYIGNEEILDWTQIAHWGVGIAALAIFFIHYLSKTLPRRAGGAGRRAGITDLTG